jgi:hypothetical protein
MGVHVESGVYHPDRPIGIWQTTNIITKLLTQFAADRYKYTSFCRKIYVYKCTEAGLNSRANVPSKVHAS